MDAKLKEDWIRALRSGEYEQGIFNFELNGKFCCLGVLCAVAGVPTTLRDGENGNWDFVQHKAGVALKAMVLARMNDSGKSFIEIADYIEKEL